MLTKEQIKNLKPGDSLVVHGKLLRICGDGELCIKVKSTELINSTVVDNQIYIHPDCVSIPSKTEVTTPKHNTCRLFRKGDWVRIVKHQGRKFNAAPPAFQLGKTYRVSEDENTEHCYVMLQSCDLHYAHPVAFLELVIPVEAREPYYIESETFDYEIRNANDDPDIGTSWAFHIKFQDPDEREILSVKSYYESYVYSSENAEADAEAECARLNAEWRKEQDND